MCSESTNRFQFESLSSCILLSLLHTPFLFNIGSLWTLWIPKDRIDHGLAWNGHRCPSGWLHPHADDLDVKVVLAALLELQHWGVGHSIERHFLPGARCKESCGGEFELANFVPSAQFGQGKTGLFLTPSRCNEKNLHAKFVKHT